MNSWMSRTVGMRPGFRGTANALQGGSTPPPAAIILRRWRSDNIKLQ